MSPHCNDGFAARATLWVRMQPRLGTQQPYITVCSKYRRSERSGKAAVRQSDGAECADLACLPCCCAGYLRAAAATVLIPSANALAAAAAIVSQLLTE